MRLRTYFGLNTFRCSNSVTDGGPLEGQSQHFFLTIEVAEIIPYRYAKRYEDVSFLTDLSLRKGWSLRRISEELECSKGTVRKKLLEAGIEIKEQTGDDKWHSKTIRELIHQA